MGRDPATITRSLVNLVVRVGDTRVQAIADIPPSHRMHEELIIAGSPNELTDRLLAIYATGIEEVSLFMPLDAVQQVDMIAERVLPELKRSLA